MRTSLRLCLGLAAVLLLTPPAGWGESPARSPRPPAAAAGLPDPAGRWLARLLGEARAALAPRAPKGGAPAPAAKAITSGHRGCIDPNGSPCT